MNTLPQKFSTTRLHPLFQEILASFARPMPTSGEEVSGLGTRSTQIPERQNVKEKRLEISESMTGPKPKLLLCARCGQPIERTDTATFFVKHIFWQHVDPKSTCSSAEPPVYEVPKRKAASNG
jgi:hypothetical protein